MSGLAATDAVSETALVVAAESRPIDVLEDVERHGATHAAVFDGDTFLGVVAFRSILRSNPERIFADLLRLCPTPLADPSTPLPDLVSLMQGANADAVALLDGDARFTGVATCESIRAALQAEERAYWQEAERTQSQNERLRMLGQMCAAVAHDLNNALTPVLAYLEMLNEDGQLPESSRQRALPALTSARDAAEVVRRLQHFYRPHPTQRDAVAVDVTALANQVRVLARPKWSDEAKLRGRRVDLRVETGADCVVEGRPSELREALLNLVFNAVDGITGSGLVQLRVALLGDAVLVEVSDNGGGMDAEQLSRCFDPFYTTKGSAGTGLGLTVVREIVEGHGGSVEIDSGAEKGTTVRILLPAAGAMSEAADTMPHRARSETWSVLYVDDDPRLHPPVQAMLGRLGHRAEVATSADAALVLVQARHYDVVVADLTMLGMDGCALVRTLRRRAPCVATVLASGWDPVEVQARVRDVDGPDAVLQKPFSLRELEQALRAAVVARRADV